MTVRSIQKNGTWSALHLQKTVQEKLQGRRVCLGLDRLDYTKVIPERLRAFDRLLCKYPLLQQKIVFVQAGSEAALRFRAIDH